MTDEKKTESVVEEETAVGETKAEPKEEPTPEETAETEAKAAVEAAQKDRDKAIDAIDGMLKKAKGEETEETTAADEKVSGAEDGKGQEPVEGELSQTVIDRAAGYGLTPDEAKEFGSDKALEAFFTNADKQMAKLGRQTESAEQETTETEPKPKVQPKKAAETETVKEVDPFEGINWDDFDPELKAAFEKEQAHHKSELAKRDDRIGKLESVVGDVIGRYKAQEVEYAENQFETWLSGLGAEWEPIFGKGPGGKMDKNSDAYKNRVRVWNATDAMAVGYGKKGLKLPDDRKEWFNRGLRTEFGDKFGEITRKKMLTSARTRKGQFIGKPNGRESKETVTERDAAIAAVEKVKTRAKGGGGY